MTTVFLRVLDAEDKAAALLAAVREPVSAKGPQRFDVNPVSFKSVPCSPFAYWGSPRLRELFTEIPPFESGGRVLLGGLKTLSDERFVRAWWEIPEGSGDSWPSLAKGGAFSPIYADVYLCVGWKSKGEDISWYGYQRRPREGFGASNRGAAAYFRPGLTWPRRTQGGLSVRAMPAGCVFSDKGPAAFVSNDDGHDLLALLAITNSRAFNAMVEMHMAFGSYEVGVLQRTPVPHLTESLRDELGALARRAWLQKRSLDSRTENSHAFMLPALLQVTGFDLPARFSKWCEQVRAVESDLKDIQITIEDRCFALYGIDEAGRRSITEGFDARVSENKSSNGEIGADADFEDEAVEFEAAVDAKSLAAELVSWAVGAAFGRFDVRAAIATHPPLVDFEPFGRLLQSSPGMLAGEEGLPLFRQPSDYPLACPEMGVLVDDVGHTQDLSAAVRAVFGLVFGNRSECWWNDVAAVLEPKTNDLRAWFADSFFEHHLKRYSKGRRRAPILWQLSTPSGRYSIWLYAHRLSRDSFFQILSEVVGPKLNHEERKLTSLIQNAGTSTSALERKEIAVQEDLVDELRLLRDEMKRIAPLWNPNLDDGVIVTMAPLWRLVPQHKPWQRELKRHWEYLTAGKYDWAHIAMHLWPERVVPKCTSDRSLAIAHGLDSDFWIKGQDGEWTARNTPARPVDNIVRQRTSPAVKAALNSLLEAPTSLSPKGSARRKGPR